MKKLYLALVCIAGLARVTACGGSNKNSGAEAAAEGENATEQQAEAGAKLDKEPQTAAEQKTLAAAEWALDKICGLTLDDVKPAYEYEILDKGMHATMGNKSGGTLSFIKKDGSPVSEEEFKAYVAKIYPLAQKLSPTGKIHKGQGKSQNNKPEVQQQELTLGDIDYSGSVDLAFPEKEDFEGFWHHIRIYNKTADGKAYLALTFN